MPTLLTSPPPPPPHNRTNMNDHDQEGRHRHHPHHPQGVAADNNDNNTTNDTTIDQQNRSIALLDESSSSTVFDWSFHDENNHSNKGVDNLNQQSQDVVDTENYDKYHHGHEDFGIMSPRQLNDKNRARRSAEEEDKQRRRSFGGTGRDIGRKIDKRDFTSDTSSSRSSNGNDNNGGNERPGNLLHGHPNHGHLQHEEEKNVTFDDSITIVGSPMPIQEQQHQQQHQRLNDVDRPYHHHQHHDNSSSSSNSPRSPPNLSNHRHDDDRSRKTTSSMEHDNNLNNQSISSDISLTIDDDHHHHHNYGNSYGINSSNQHERDHHRHPRDTSTTNSYYSQSQQSQIEDSDDGDTDDRDFRRYVNDNSKQTRLSSPSSAVSSLVRSPSNRSTIDYYRSDISSDPSFSLSPIVYKDRSWPNRDEYQTKYESKVKQTLSKFQSLYPGKLIEYKTMTPDEQAKQRERVLALMERVRSGHYKRQITLQATNQAENTTLGVATHHQRHQQSQSPVANWTVGGSTTLVETQHSNHVENDDRIMDETIQPSFSPQVTLKSTDPSQRHLSSTTSSGQSMSSQSNHLSVQKSVQSPTIASSSSPDPSPRSRTFRAADKSELLLSPEEGSNDGESNRSTSSSVSMEFPQPDIDDNNNSYSGKDDSISSVEVPRGTTYDDDDGRHTDSDLSFGTPEDQVQRSSQGSGALKRQATTSGKRGADTQRSRYNEIGHVDVVSSRLSRMSISPQQSKRHSSSPDNLFPASQSPISLQLTSSPNVKDGFGPNEYGNSSVRNERISWGTENRYSIPNSNVNDSVVTSRSLRPGKNNSRSIREVPTNVSLMDGATFHLDKLSVKRTKQLERSQSGRPRDPSRMGISALQRRRLVSFPDPFVKYNKRIRPALKEMHQWIQGAEHEFDEGESNIPALGVFFSLSYQQIIDLGLKLLLSEAPRTGLDQSSSKSMIGNTIIICRSKEDCGKWESAFRDGTGCSVLNHAALPLSERIRSATAERACLHDVVLTTFDSMKSPDVAIPITDNGHVILKSREAAVGWQSSRSGSQMVDATPQKTKQLSVLHRIHYKRVIFVDVVGRKCYLAKGGTARNAAATALSGDSRLAFFCKSEADGDSALAALKKSDKSAFQAVSTALRLSSYEDAHSDDDESDGDSSDDGTDGRNRSLHTSTIATIALDLNDIL